MKKKENAMRIGVLFLITLFLVSIQGNVVLGASAKKDEKKATVTNREIIGWQNSSRALAPRYERLVQDIRSGKERVDRSIGGLRGYYAYTRYYEPFSKSIIDEMTKYAYIVDTSKDRKEVNAALDKYRELIFRHLAHLGVVSYALTLSRLDIRYGDEEFLKAVRDAIRGAWAHLPEPGSTPERAYNIITYAEEEYILETYGAIVKKSEIYKVENKFYDVRDIVTEDGEEIQLFFDVSIPIRTVQMIQGLREKEQKVIIPLQ